MSSHEPPKRQSPLVLWNIAESLAAAGMPPQEAIKEARDRLKDQTGRRPEARLVS